MKFAIAIEIGTDITAFGVVVPDLPGCFSAGDTVEEAFDNAREAIEAYVEALAEDGKPIPETRPLSELQKDKEYKGWAWGIVDVPVEKLFGPAEKINITVPALLLKRIDAYAVMHGNSRSAFLAHAAVNAMRGSTSVDTARAESSTPLTALAARENRRSKLQGPRPTARTRHK